MARLNGRQKRALKRRIALALLAQVRNPSSQSKEGDVRSVYGKKRIIENNRILAGVSVGMRENSVNTPPKRGKVLKGNFKPVSPLKRHLFDAQPRKVSDPMKHPLGTYSSDVEPTVRQEAKDGPAKVAFDAIMNEPKKAPVIDD